MVRNRLIWGAPGLVLLAAACGSEGGIFNVAYREPGGRSPTGLLDASLGGPSGATGGNRAGTGGTPGASGAFSGGTNGTGGCIGEACPAVGSLTGCCTMTGQCGVVFGTTCFAIPMGVAGMPGAGGAGTGGRGTGGSGGASGAGGRATGGRSGAGGALDTDAGTDGGVDAGAPCGHDADCTGGRVCCATSQVGSVSGLTCATSCAATEAPIHCNGPADCTGGKVCCGDVNAGVYRSLSCVDQCPARTNGNGGYIVCKASTECTNPDTCQASQSLPAGFTVCR